MLNGGKLDWILTLATERFQVPQAFVALAAETVEETMNRIPLDRQEAEYVLALRNQTLETGDMLVMLDSHAEKVPSGALAAPAEPAIRFYAGAPLVLAKTEQIGTLILIDRAPHGAFSAETAATIRARSPTSLKLTLQALRRARHLDFAGCMVMEYRVLCHILEGHDFDEGVRAAVIDKDRRPCWRPATLDEVAAADIEAYFRPPAGGDIVLD
jgi:enoyl-CoA hydratase